MSLPEALELAAGALPDQADVIRPANGDPIQLLSALDDDGCGVVLAWLLANEPEAGEELLLDWCEDDRGIACVQSLDVGALPKSGKKLLRKALHRMRTSGVDVAVVESRSAPVVPNKEAVADELNGAYMTPVDPRGSVLVFLVEANPSGGARLFQTLLDERRGVVEFNVYATGRSKTRSFLRMLTDSTSTGAAGAVEIDSGVARETIARVASAHPSDRPFPRAFSEWRRKLETGRSDSTPGEAARASLGNVLDASDETLERVAARVRDKDLGPWPPNTARITEVSETLGSAVDDLLQKPAKARATALEKAVGAATSALFNGDHGAQTASRFEASAYVAQLGGNDEEARDLLVAADSFRGEDLGSNPIARAMTEAFTATVLKRAEDPLPKESGDASPPDGT